MNIYLKHPLVLSQPRHVTLHNVTSQTKKNIQASIFEADKKISRKCANAQAMAQAVTQKAIEATNAAVQDMGVA